MYVPSIKSPLVQWLGFGALTAASRVQFPIQEPHFLTDLNAIFFFFFILPINVLNVLFNFSQFSLHSFVFIFMSRFESETFQSRVFFKIRVLVKICFNFNQVKQNYWRVIMSILCRTQQLLHCRSGYSFRLVISRSQFESQRRLF